MLHEGLSPVVQGTLPSLLAVQAGCHERAAWVVVSNQCSQPLAMQVLHMTDHNKPAWDELLWGVRTGNPPFEYTHNGMSEFEWLKANPSEEDKFSKAMKEVDSLGEAYTHLLLTSLRWHRWTGETVCKLADTLSSCIACLSW